MQPSVLDESIKVRAPAWRCCLTLQHKWRRITSGEAEGKHELGRAKINEARRDIVFKKESVYWPTPPLLRCPTSTCTTACWCWPTPSTGNWKTGSGTAWPAWTAWGSRPSPGTEAGQCWTPSRRYFKSSKPGKKLIYLISRFGFDVQILCCSPCHFLFL